MASIKFLTGWSKEGGSTLHHIWLVTKLNEMGHDASLWGPHDYHTQFVPGGRLQNCEIFNNDTVVAHYVNIASVANLRPLRLVVSCHESPALNGLANQDLTGADAVHFVSAGQKSAHNLSIDSTVIPPNVADVVWNGGPGKEIAGVIGSVDYNKQPHVAAQQALEDGFRKVLLYGRVNDPNYFTTNVLPLLIDGRVEHRQHAEREEVFNSIDAVYCSSKSETYGMVEAEAKKSNIPFYGASYAPEVMDSEEILQKWVELLEV